MARKKATINADLRRPPQNPPRPESPSQLPSETAFQWKIPAGAPIILQPYQEALMLNVQDGQCGLCAHFGEHHQAEPELVQIRTSHKADEKTVEACGLPEHADLHLMVTANSSCTGFEPAKAN
jgi:hypothetical protein